MTAPRNPPGLSEVGHRAGTYATFLAAMVDRLSTHRISHEDGSQTRPLAGLAVRTQDPSIALLDAWAVLGDILAFSIERAANEGFLGTARDRRSVVELARLTGHVLDPPLGASTHLAFLIADDPAGRIGVRLPQGTRAQSVPGPGETPSTYETSEDLDAWPQLNELRPRLTRPPALAPEDAATLDVVYARGPRGDLLPGDRLLFEYGDAPGAQVIRQIASVEIDAVADRTALRLVTPVSFREAVGELARSVAAWQRRRQYNLPQSALVKALIADLRRLGALIRRGVASDDLLERIDQVVPRFAHAARRARTDAATKEWAVAVATGLHEAARELERLAGETGARSLRVAGGAGPPPATVGDSLDRIAEAIQDAEARPGAAGAAPPDPRRLFDPDSDVLPQILETVRPELKGTLRPALAGADLAEPSVVQAIWVLRTVAAPFGAAAPRVPVVSDGQVTETLEWTLDGSRTVQSQNGDGTELTLAELTGPHAEDAIALDIRVPQVVPRSWIVLQRHRDVAAEAFRAAEVETAGVAAYNLSGTVTRVHLERPWLAEADEADGTLAAIRDTTVHVAAEPLELADEPIPDGVAGGEVELDAVYEGIEPGRLVAVAGERTDLPGITGVPGGELARVTGVELRVDPSRPSDPVRTVLQLAGELRYAYAPPTVTIYANIAAATQGESVDEILGGAGAVPRQEFTLSRKPLTHLPSDEASGAERTLEVRVDDVRWTGVESFADLDRDERGYVVRRDADETVHVQFGDGAGRGARPPSGVDNVRARYRHGAGGGGNVAARRITQLLTRPLGVRDVLNPLPATGGAEPESIIAARRTIPLAVTALDRLVSVRDYEDFAAARAGVGKARAAKLADGRRTVVHVTISGADVGPVDPASLLVTGLRAAFAANGDPQLPVEVDVRELALIVLVAGIAAAPDRTWEAVEGAVRAALLDAFGYERRGLGQDVVLSEVVATVQGVPGVDHVDVDGLALVPEGITTAGLQDLPDQLAAAPPGRLRVEDARPDPGGGRILPAQVAILSPALPDLLILRRL